MWLLYTCKERKREIEYVNVGESMGTGKNGKSRKLGSAANPSEYRNAKNEIGTNNEEAEHQMFS